MLALMDAFYRSTAYSLHCCRECSAYKAQLHKADLLPKGCYCHLGTTDLGLQDVVCCNHVACHGIIHVFTSTWPETAANNLYQTVAARYYSPADSQSLGYACSFHHQHDITMRLLSQCHCLVMPHLLPVTVPPSCLAPLTLHLINLSCF